MVERVDLMHTVNAPRTAAPLRAKNARLIRVLCYALPLLALSGCWTHPGGKGESIVIFTTKEQDKVRFATEAEAEKYIADLTNRIAKHESTDAMFRILELTLETTETAEGLDVFSVVIARVNYELDAKTPLGDRSVRIRFMDANGVEVGVGTADLKIRSKRRANLQNGIILTIIGFLCFSLGAWAVDEAGPFALALLLSGILIFVGGIASLLIGVFA